MACLCGKNKQEAVKADTSSDPMASFDSLSVLENVRLFQGLKKSILIELKNGLKKKKFEAGEKLMTYGEKGTEFYIIVNGKCSVLTKNEEEVAQLKGGDYCGEQALLKEATRNATIKAMLPTHTLWCDKKIFDSIVKGSVTFVKRDAKRRAVIQTVQSTGDFSQTENTEKSGKEREWLSSMVENNLMFMSLTEEQRLAVIDQMYKEDVADKTDLVKQGDKNAETFYVVEKGEFDIYVNNDLVHTIKRGGCFGELALMYKAPRAATCRANQECVVWTVRRQAFRNALAALNKRQLSQNLEFLKTVKLLKPFLHGELILIDQAMELKTYPKGDTIIKQGDAPDKFYIIKQGQGEWVKKIEKAQKGEERGDLGPTDFFGELALRSNSKRAASIYAKTELQVLELGKDDFLELFGPLEKILDRHAQSAYSPTAPAKADENKEKKTEDKKADKICGIDEFEYIGVLGKGAFGLVSLVVDPNTGRSFALKAIKKAQIVELQQQSHIVNEKRIMEQMSCPFLVNLRGTYKDKYRLYLLLDVCLGGELFTILRRRRYFNEDTSRFYAACVVQAFAYMHSKKIIYRDLKPENLVLDNNGFLKVTDFGFAKVVEDKTQTLCGTPDYLAPEIVTGQGHGKAVDWWTLGILIYEMLASFPPFFDEEPIETYRRIIKCRIKFPRYFSIEAKELIKAFLRSKPVRRLGVQKNGERAIRQHAWFQNAAFDWDALNNFKMKPPIIPKVKDPRDISNFEKFTDNDDDALVAISESEDLAFAEF